MRQSVALISSSADLAIDSMSAPLAAVGLDGLCKGYLSDFDSTEVTGKLVAGSTVCFRSPAQTIADPLLVSSRY